MRTGATLLLGIAMPGFFVHAIEESVPEGAHCDRCGKRLVGRAGLPVAALVSYDGKAAKFRICLDCRQEAAISYGQEPAPAPRRKRGG